MGVRTDKSRYVMLVLILIAFCAAFYKVAQRSPAAEFKVPEIASGQPAPADFHTHFASTRQNISTHAASLIEMNDGRIRAFWFAGSKEGAADVEIVSAIYDPAKDTWGTEQSIANRVDTGRGLLRYVKKIGNPVPAHAQDGTLWLFYVTVSLGGWAGSSITAITSGDDGATWSQPRRLVTSPFINISTLVKGTPFLYSDGTMGLPVYHEFIGKFGELLRIGPDGTILDKQRLSSGKSTLQPIVLVKNPQQALVLMRRSGNSPPRVISTDTADVGQHWSKSAPTTLDNPDASITGTVLADGKMLAVLNKLKNGRDALSLLMSNDGGATWKTIYLLEDQRGQPADLVHYKQVSARLARSTDSRITDAASYADSAQRNKCDLQNCAFEFSYPYLIQARNGDIHLVYTWNRSFIKHVRFNRDWLAAQNRESHAALN